MVKKMKLKFSFAILLVCMLPFAAHSAETKDFRCGTNLSTRAFAYRVNGTWKGFDADICRAFAWAIHGDGNKFTMVDVKDHEIEQALHTGKVDIVLSNNSNPATMEIKQRANSVGVLYYDRQLFAVSDVPEKGSSITDYKGKKVCVYAGSDYLENLKSYNIDNELDFKILAYKTLTNANKGFELNKCDVFSMQGLVLQNIAANSKSKKMTILPEEFAYKPIYAYVNPQNNDMRIMAKWILNSLYAAEEMGLRKDNATEFDYGFDTDVENMNLFGDDNLLWKFLKVRPDWLRLAVGDVGNIGEIFENNLGAKSSYNLKRGKAALVKDGGEIRVDPLK
ncbi:MAG: transporter substrate-binding domain-containing protein [Alphaproteobacteria bacterium]|nr:transporter substrate-binding domain-containing protein [Alphaproteobacteria bacterium]